MGYFLCFWLIAFPFIYGQGISRLFGLRKKIDHWILFTLHISVSVLAMIVGFVIFYSMMYFEAFNSAFIYVPLCYAIFVVVEGFVWQFVLTERILNGFLCSLIANTIYAAPIIIIIAITISETV